MRLRSSRPRETLGRRTASARRGLTTALFIVTMLAIGLAVITRAYGLRSAGWALLLMALFALGTAFLTVRRANQQLQEACERAREDKRDFVATISHEFRTPLTAIVGFSQLLDDDTRPLSPERRRYYLGFVKEQSQHLARMIEDTVDLSRADEGRLALHPTTTGLHRVIESALTMLGSPGAAARVRVSIAPDTPHVWADPGELEQVLDRLFHVLLAGSDGEVQVEVGPTREGGVRVALGAAGLDAGAETLAPLTGDLSLWRQSERYMGTAAARAIIQLHGGRVWVEPRGEETAIIFELPAGGGEPDLGEPAAPTPALA